MSFIFWSMPYQLFQILGERERQVVAQNIGLLTGLIDTSQKEEWIEFLSGGIPSQILTWRGSLQEAYYLFNQIRIASLNSHSIIRIQTKNRGLDWVKINKVVLTRFGKVQKESRPQTTDNIDLSIQLFLSKMNKF